MLHDGIGVMHHDKGCHSIFARFTMQSFCCVTQLWARSRALQAQVGRLACYPRCLLNALCQLTEQPTVDCT